MFNLTVRDTSEFMEPFNLPELFEIELLAFELYLCWIELFEIEGLLNLTVYKPKQYLNKWLHK